MNRRRFLHTAVAAGMAGLLPSAVRADASPKVRERKDVAKLDPNGPELTAYRKAVTVMKQRSMKDNKDRIGWEAQARIHLDSCPHGNWFFFPWHRTYLWRFEEICRAACGNPDFALPYWDWTTHPSIPASFWGQDNVLIDNSRVVKQQEETDREFVGESIVHDILDTEDFIAFAGGATDKLRPERRVGGGLVEVTPHNYVHNFVGGNMGGFLSPLDPVFWLHHANVDRLWTVWGARHAEFQLDDPRFLNLEMAFFDTAGKEVKNKVKDVLNTATLGYRYPGQRTDQPPAPKLIEVVLAPAPGLSSEVEVKGVIRGDQPLAVPLPAAEPLQAQLAGIARAAKEKKTHTAVRLTIEVMKPPKDTNVAVRVFLNDDKANEKTPVKDNPHYVGTFMFFEHAGEGHGHRKDEGATIVLDAAPALRRLGDRFDAKAPLKVQLVVVPMQPGRKATEALTPGKVQISVIQAGDK